jgi:hypothetical protein
VAISTVGYTGQVNQLEWALLNGEISPQYTRASPQDFLVYVQAGVRGVLVSQGVAVGYGVKVKSDTVISRSLPTPSGGQWHLVVLRRDWTNSSADVVTIPADTTLAGFVPTAQNVPAAYPAARKTSPGSGQDDQPLAWAWVTSANANTVVFPISPRHNLTARLARLEAIPHFIAQGGSDRDNQVADIPGVDLTTLAGRIAFQNRAPLCERLDFGWTERYYAEYDAATNPGGISPAGWYPIAGGDTGWKQANASDSGIFLAANYANLITASVPWQGLQIRRKNGFVTISGAVTKSTAIAALETVATLAANWRPTVTAAGFASVGSTTTIALVRPDGTLTTAASGVAGSQITFALTFPVA